MKALRILQFSSKFVSVTDPDLDDQPLTDEEIERMISNISCLEHMIDPYDALDMLTAVNCVTRRHAESIKVKPSTETVNRELLQTLSRRSKAHLKTFLDALKETGQDYLVELFQKNGGKYENRSCCG